MFYITCAVQTGSPDKISKIQMGKDGGDRHENGDQNNTVQMDAEESEDQNQDMSSEDESENCKAVMSSKIFNNTLLY